MVKLIIFNKPFNVLSQFTNAKIKDESCQTLADFIKIKDVYPAGRLDKDSEGLLVLTDDGITQAKISDPKFKITKSYWVQVEGLPDELSLDRLRKGIRLKDGLTLPTQIEKISEPDYLWKRNPPVRFRKIVPDSWIEITISEGRNRQVRRMTAAIGFPTLRLIRHRVGELKISNLQPGDWQYI